LPLTKTQAARCFVRDEWHCRHCKTSHGLHPHHMIYKSAGGPDTEDNLLTLCHNCHRMHHDGFLRIEWGTEGGNGPVTFTRLKGWTRL
jgi:5-methylcytosine-specific restriction endonuclease McrA